MPILSPYYQYYTFWPHFEAEIFIVNLNELKNDLYRYYRSTLAI